MFVKEKRFHVSKFVEFLTLRGQGPWSLAHMLPVYSYTWTCITWIFSLWHLLKVWTGCKQIITLRFWNRTLASRIQSGPLFSSVTGVGCAILVHCICTLFDYIHWLNCSICICDYVRCVVMRFLGPLCRVNPLTDRGKRFQLIKILCLTVIPILGVWGFTMYSLSDSVKSKSEIEVVRTGSARVVLQDKQAAYTTIMSNMQLQGWICCNCKGVRICVTLCCLRFSRWRLRRVVLLQLWLCQGSWSSYLQCKWSYADFFHGCSIRILF